MTNRKIFIAWLTLAIGLALSWYPLKQLKDLQIGSPQLLFYAFASASLCTAPWLAYQVRSWRAETQALLSIGLSGACMVTFLHFSLLNGSAESVFSIFSLVPTTIFLLKSVLSEEPFHVGEFSIFVMVIIACFTVLFNAKNGFNSQWMMVTSLLAGLFCYVLFMLQSRNTALPLASKLSAVFICSTWLVGMVIIFSTKFVSFPQENAVLASILYGIFCLTPVLLAVLKIMTHCRRSDLLIWLALTLLVSVVSLRLIEGGSYEIEAWASVFFLLLSAGILSIKQFK